MSVYTDEKATETFSEKLVCESCGESFPCGSKTGKCWCFEISVNQGILKELQKDFGSCLCMKCLENLSRSENIKSA